MPLSVMFIYPAGIVNPNRIFLLLIVSGYGVFPQQQKTANVDA